MRCVLLRDVVMWASALLQYRGVCALQVTLLGVLGTPGYL